jgi:hypothetical protein
MRHPVFLFTLPLTPLRVQAWQLTFEAFIHNVALWVMAVWLGSRLTTFRKNISQDSQTYDMHAQNDARRTYLGTRHSLLSHNFYIFCPTRVSILWAMCVCIHICDCVQVVCELPVLPGKTASAIFLHKSGAVRSVDWMFIIGLPAWRWLGE